MPSTILRDRCGRRSPATLSSFHQGRPPRNKGLRYPADPPTVEEIIAVMHAAGDDADAVRLRGMIVVLWRAGLRISEALALSESDLDPNRGAFLVRHGQGGKRREVGRTAGPGSSSRRGYSFAPGSPSAHCSACCAARLAVGRGRPPVYELSFTLRRPEPACDVALRRTSCGMPTRWRCPARGYLY